jgi:lactoylglutathione lyase
MAEQFGFTKLVVSDLDASLAFYSSVFGLTEANRVTADIGGRHIDEIMLNPTAPGGPSLVLLRFDDRKQPATGELILGFVSDDVQALVDRAVAAGGTLIEPVRSMPEHGVNVGFVTDPEGHLLELVELLKG